MSEHSRFGESSIGESIHDNRTDTSVHEAIARLAYALWQERAGADGFPEQDWLEAERRLTERSPLGE